LPQALKRAEAYGNFLEKALNLGKLRAIRGSYEQFNHV
jgi:hypothetical protein